MTSIRRVHTTHTELCASCRLLMVIILTNKKRLIYIVDKVIISNDYIKVINHQQYDYLLTWHTKILMNNNNGSLILIRHKNVMRIEMA